MFEPRQKSLKTLSLVVKRTNTGETDRVLTLLTRDFGRLTVSARGCRKLNSRRIGLLEPGNLIDAYLIKTNGWPILTQANLIDSFSQLKSSLVKCRQLTQILEILDTLTVNDSDQILFDLVQNLLSSLKTNQSFSFVSTKKSLDQLIAHLGYQTSTQAGFSSIIEYVSSIADKEMKSFKYLSPNNLSFQ